MKTAVSVSKAFNVIGVVVHIVYFVLAIISLCCYYTQSPPAEGGLPLSFSWWFWSTMVAAACIFCYLIGVTFGIMTEEKLINIVKLILVLAAIPMYIFIGGASGVADFIVWNVFFLVLFAVHLVPLIIEFKQKRRYKRVVQTSPLPLQGRSEPEAASFPNEG